MPELPEIETIRRGLGPLLVGRRVLGVEVRDPRLREPIASRSLARLRGAAVTAVRRRSKYLLLDTDSGLTLLIHLGMTGQLWVADRDKPAILGPVQALVALGFEVISTAGTAAHLAAAGVPVRTVAKYSEGSPNVVDQILAGDVDLVVNTPRGRGPRADGYEIRAAAVRRNIPYVTTMQGVRATVAGIEALRRGGMTVRSLQEYLTAPCLKEAAQ